MRAILALLVLCGLLLGGCGSEEDRKRQEEAEKKKEWTDYAPGDPRGDVKALNKAKEIVREAEETRKLPEEEPLADPEGQ